jgi:hypothetical protein
MPSNRHEGRAAPPDEVPLAATPCVEVIGFPHFSVPDLYY